MCLALAIFQLNIRASECSRGLDFLLTVNEGKPISNLLDKENAHQVLEQLKVYIRPIIKFGKLFLIIFELFVSFLVIS